MSNTACVVGSDPTQVCFVSSSCLPWLADKHPDVVKGTDPTTPTKTRWRTRPFAYPASWPLSIVSGIMISGSSIWCCEEFWEIQPPSSSQDSKRRSNRPIELHAKNVACQEWLNIWCVSDAHNRGHVQKRTRAGGDGRSTLKIYADSAFLHSPNWCRSSAWTLRLT